MRQVTALGPASHGRSHRSSAAESGQGNTPENVPATLVSATEKPVSETWQSERTVPSKGAAEPDTPTADSGTVLFANVPSQSTVTCAVTVVPAAGAST